MNTSAFASLVTRYGDLPCERALHVSGRSGTDLTLELYDPVIIPYSARTPGSHAYSPPAEISYSVRPGSAFGVIFADVTVGELRVGADLIDPFGRVDEPVRLLIMEGAVVDAQGGDMARRLKSELWRLPFSCRKLVEFGIGLSCILPSGIIGIDESIAGTCHFGFGNGSDNDAPIHLDVVVDDFMVSW